MDPELKTKWVKALRSGKYKQGNGQLKLMGGEYCCLGLLCEIHPDGKWMNGIRPVYRFEGESAWAYLPNVLRERIGIDPFEEIDVAKLNDANKSFDEIADWIEENL